MGGDQRSEAVSAHPLAVMPFTTLRSVGSGPVPEEGVRVRLFIRDGCSCWEVPGGERARVLRDLDELDRWFQALLSPIETFDWDWPRREDCAR